MIYKIVSFLFLISWCNARPGSILKYGASRDGRLREQQLVLVALQLLRIYME